MKKKNHVGPVGKEVRLERTWMTGRKYRIMRYVPFVFILSLLIFVNSCAQMRSSSGYYIAYTGNRAILSVVRSSAKIGVIAYSKSTTYNELLGTTTTNEYEPLTELHSLRTIVEAALIANGFNVVRDDVYDFLTNSNYQLLGLGALLNGKSSVNSKAQMLFADTWFALENKLLEETGVTDLLVISMVDQYKYNVSLIDVRTKSVIVSFAINADSVDGWDSFMKPINNKQWVDYNSDYEGQYYAWGQLANKIVSLLEGRR
ncbi:MAG: hypothetical protein M1381_11900 [Deltaproteobacteria bacterium]|nr:hypothetical protein [Deltaproteobacteria bacterium]